MKQMLTPTDMEFKPCNTARNLTPEPRSISSAVKRNRGRKQVENKDKATAFFQTCVTELGQPSVLPEEVTTPYSSRQSAQESHLIRGVLKATYASVIFHIICLFFFPEFFNFLRYPSVWGHPLLLLPEAWHFLGHFFNHINGPILYYVERGVFLALVFAGLLHFCLLLLTASAWASRNEKPRHFRPDKNCAGAFKLPSDTSCCPEEGVQMISYVTAFVRCFLAGSCLVLTVVQVTNFLYGGWPCKAIGFPDIYLGALTKPGGFWGFEGSLEVMLQHSDLSLLPDAELQYAVKGLHSPRSHYLFTALLILGFVVDLIGLKMQVGKGRLISALLSLISS